MGGLQKLTGTFRSAGHKTISWLRTYRVHCLKAAGAIAIFTAVTVGGNQYVQANMNEVYHLMFDGVETGIVSNPKVVEKYIIEKYEKLDQLYPDIHMVMNTELISFHSEKAFKAESDNEQALANLEPLLEPQALGVKLMIDGQEVAVVKDKETAQTVLTRLKEKYAEVPKEKGKVSILSVMKPSDTAADEETSIESVEFVEDVGLVLSEIDPNEISDPDDVLHDLETGDMGPFKYTVQSGDCISCIADKFGIPTEIIYNNNGLNEHSIIRVGDELDLTVLHPKLSVKTVEKLVEDQEIQYDTEYRSDPDMRKGQVKILSPGRNGLKKVTYRITKINGLTMEEELTEEEIIDEPVTAIALRGTKVIVGEGSGRFAWPVVGARVTSKFGKRWGSQHAGIDMVASNKSILASDNGKVSFAGTKNGYGNVVIVDHKNGYQTLYAHMSKITAKKGQVVAKGDKLGVMGNTGNSYGVHLHFEIHKKGVAENPTKYLSK